MPDWLQSDTFKWVANNGFAVVIAILLLTMIVTPVLALLRYVIFDAVRYFTNRLDDMSKAQSAAFDKLTTAIEHQNEAMERQTEQIGISREQAARNNEALSALLMFVSHTQQEVVAHRVEARQQWGSETLDAPTTPGVGTSSAVLKPVDLNEKTVEPEEEHAPG